MPPVISEARARFAAEALASLAGQIRRYCQSYPQRLAGLRGRARARALERFLENAQTLVAMVTRMTEMAREIAAMGILNFEQLEAEAAEARERVEAVRQLEAAQS